MKTNPTTGLPDTTGTSTWQALHPGCPTGTDWQRAIYRAGSQQQHRLSYNSVSGNARLSLSGTYFSQSGITLGQDEATSDVYGMNKVAFVEGNLDRQFALDEAAAVIAHYMRRLRG